MGLDGQFSANDRALIAEAVRRVENSRQAGAADRSAITMAISSALLAGRRDLFGLVKAGQQASES